MSSADQILTHLDPKGIQSMGKLTPVGASRLAEGFRRTREESLQD